MPRERKEAAGVGEHADEVREQSHRHQRAEVLLHALLLVVEPPRRAELHSSPDILLRERPGDDGQLCVVRRVQAVQHGLRQVIGCFQRVEVAQERTGKREIPYHVETGVRPQPREELRVHVAHRAHVQLLHPAFLGIHPGQRPHHGGLEGPRLAHAGLGASADGLEDPRCLVVAALFRVRLFQPVI